MARATILRRFKELTAWRRGNQRAPHKPLLVLYAPAKSRPPVEASAAITVPAGRGVSSVQVRPLLVLVLLVLVKSRLSVVT